MLKSAQLSICRIHGEFPLSPTKTSADKDDAAIAKSPLEIIRQGGIVGALCAAAWFGTQELDRRDERFEKHLHETRDRLERRQALHESEFGHRGVEGAERDHAHAIETLQKLVAEMRATLREHTRLGLDGLRHPLGVVNHLKRLEARVERLEK
jgi:hypothetical protein